MPNEQIKNYIQESSKVGMSREDIRKNLLAAGWQSTDVEEALGTPPPTAVPGAMPVSPQKPSQPKSHKKWIWVSIIIILIVLGVGAYLLFSKPHAAAPAGPSPATTTPSQPSAATSTANVPPPAVVAATCTASEPSSTTDIQGTVTAVDSSGNNQKLTDTCGDATYLIKYICYESPIGSGHYGSGRTVIKCTNGCANGACKQ